MKISIENPSRMVLLDHNYTAYVAGAGLFIVGGYFGVSYLSTNMLAAGAGALFALIGIAIVATSKMLTITLDKTTGKGTIELKGIIGSGSRDLELGKIKKLTLNKIISSQTRNRGTHSEYFVNFVLDTGESLPFKLANVSAGMTGMIMSPDEKETRFVKQVADFLGVPMEFVAPPSMGQAISSITQGIS